MRARSMTSGIRPGVVLAALNLATWISILANREPTAWQELEQRRPRLTATGVHFEANTAWGIPLFGCEIGGCFRESRVVSAFMLINAPAVIGGALAYGSLELSSLRVEVLSWLAGSAALTFTTAQWILIGVLVGRLRHPHQVPV